MHTKRRPGEVRDAIISALAARPEGASTSEIENAVKVMVGHEWSVMLHLLAFVPTFV